MNIIFNIVTGQPSIMILYFKTERNKLLGNIANGLQSKSLLMKMWRSWHWTVLYYQAPQRLKLFYKTVPRNPSYDQWNIPFTTLYEDKPSSFHAQQGYYLSYTGRSSRLARLALIAVALTRAGKTFLSTKAPLNNGPNIGTWQTNK